MNFKRLELYGFKSFADKTIVDFNDGITGIVGPNGSGKSNFSDGIKWVLGEQSPKSLRGKSMQDVIFAGSQRRPKMSYCEVSLVFDNTDCKIFKTLKFDEVTISRKLYRSGQSEYLLNNVTCRLSDIKDILRDTGLGKDGYSIIGQGRVAEIINSKPENRRTIFEEAAGISKYKVKKVESENKLAKTREHIDRINDIIKEIEHRLGPLERKAENAKKYNELYNELRSLEVNHYLYACDNKDIELGRIQNIINGIVEELNKISADIDLNDKEYEEYSYRLRRCEEDLATYNEERTNLMVANQKKLGDGNMYVERMKSFKENEERSKSNIDRYTATIDDCNKQIEELKEQLAIAQADSAKLNDEYAKAQQEYDSVIFDIDQKENEFEATDKAIMESLEKLSGVQVDITKLSTQFELFKENKAHLEEEIATLKQDIEQQEKERAEKDKVVNALQDEINIGYNALKKSKDRLSKLQLEKNMLHKEITDLKGAISADEARHKVMLQSKDNYESYQLAVKRIMQYTKRDSTLNSKILGVVAELIDVPKKYVTAIEVALGGALQNIVTPTIEDAKYCLNILKRERMGIATFWPINTSRPRTLKDRDAVLREDGCEGIASELIGYNKAYHSVFSSLLGATVICDTYDNATRILKKYNKAFRIVTLEGDIFSTQGSVTGGSRRQDTAGILGQEREIGDLEKRISANKEKLDRDNQRLEQVAIEEAQLVQDNAATEEQLKEKNIEANSKSAESTLLADKLNASLTKLTNVSNTYESLCDKLDLIATRLSGSDKEKQDIQIARVSIDDQKLKSKELLSNKKKERDRLQEQLSQLRAEKAEKERQIDAFTANIDDATQSAKDNREYLLNEQSVLSTIRANIATTEKDIASAELSSEDKIKLQNIESSIEKFKATKDECSQRIDSLIKEKSVNSDRQIIANEKKIKQESAIQRINDQFEQLTKRMSEEYGLNEVSAQGYKLDEFNDQEALVKISNTKRSITNLGGIDPGAIQEFEEENSRYTELTGQRDDLEQAEQELLSMIADVSKEMKDIFDYEFDKISKNFEVTFKEIFGGGSGKLVVDQNAEDPLNAGIDIVVALPGKKQGNISLLSGGEMALTAIAILFAILKSKPMPFCVLDEIEAALDDTNVSLFARYLKKFVGNTQFIVITHRKPTMEQADRLYGVTMEEKGVSKVVSVELGEAVKTIGK